MSLLDESLRAVLRDVVREELARALGTRPAAPATGMLTGRELDKAMSWSARTRKRLDTEGMPGTGTGRLRRYDVSAVRHWLDERSRPAEVIDLQARAAELLAKGRR